MEILRFENVKFIKKYDDFSIDKNEVVFVVGKSGSGDSDIMMTDTINPLKSNRA